MSSASSLSVTLGDLQALCMHFKKFSYSVPTETPEAAEALEKCKGLLELDYNVVEINNAGGVLCAHYPSKIFICESELPQAGDTSMRNEALQLETEGDVNQLRNQILKARKGRCRARFPVPVILFRGKNICRSGTTAHYAEIYGRATVEAINSYISGTSEDDFDNRGDEDQFDDEQNLDLESSVRNNDIQLLRMYNVTTIFDLMVEHKKVKYGVYVTSSEKADTENRYSDFNVINIPYPGCEFFKTFYQNGKQGKNLVFDWEQKMVDKTVTVPSDDYFRDLGIEWRAYKTWDIITLTSNYLAFVVRYIEQSKSGILIHCISGWDRTPLFVSMVRVSLWADGLIHRSLTPSQMLYFTIAYDWMLFGHNLKNRLEKFEEIFFFCFYMLKHIMDPKCSIKRFYRGPDESSPQLTPKTERSSMDNGNLEFMDEEEKSELNLCSTSNERNLFHDSCVDFLPYKRESETEMNIESDVSENDANDSFAEANDLLCGDSNILLDRDPSTLDDNLDLDLPDSQSSVESNGNDTISNRTLVPSIDSLNISCTPRKSSPVPMVRKDLPTDNDAPNGSWTIVTSTGSVHSNDGFGPLRDKVSPNRFKRLSKIREEFFRAYYHSAAVPYKEPPSAIGQVIGNLAESIGFS